MQTNFFQEIKNIPKNINKAKNGHHLATVLLAGVAIAEFMNNYYWLFTKTPLPGQKENQIVDKVFYGFFVGLMTLALKLGLGTAIDILRNMGKELQSKTDALNSGGSSKSELYFVKFLKEHPMMVIFALVGITNFILQQLWLFTDMPLSVDKGSEQGLKVLLGIAGFIAQVGYAMGLAYMLDTAVNLCQKVLPQNFTDINENSPLVLNA